ncbi:MAG: hypothetical protein ACHQDC_07825, partial [Acidimicrobiales bacterium]
MVGRSRRWVPAPPLRRPLAGAPVPASTRTAVIRVGFQDFAILGDAQATIEDGVLVLRIDLRP